MIGGGDSAVEEANYLTKKASKVYMLVRRDKLRASNVMQERALKNPKVHLCNFLVGFSANLSPLQIEILWNTQAISADGNGKLLDHLMIHNTARDTKERLDVNGLFYAIGHVPNTAFLGGQLALDEDGYIAVKPGTTETSVPGVFASGDVQDKRYRQAITAAGTGCMAALDVEKYLEASHL